MVKKILIFVLASMMLLLAACGNAAPAAQDADVTATDAPADEETVNSVDDDWQNPVMNFVGNYGCGRAMVLVEADGADGARITALWSSSYNERAQWVMTGKFDADTLSIPYEDCVNSIITYQENGEIASVDEVYSNGHGRIVFDANAYTLTWEDDQENVAEGLVFEGTVPINGEPVETEDVQTEETVDEDPDFYSAVTAMGKAAVEEIANFIRVAYLGENWDSIKNMVRYPITIYGTEINDADAFMAFMSDKTVPESDRESMEAETCHNMFLNGQGICFADGSIWINDPNYMTDETPMLQIIAINGLEVKR